MNSQTDYQGKTRNPTGCLPAVLIVGLLLSLSAAMFGCSYNNPKQVILADSLVCKEMGGIQLCSGRSSYISIESFPDSGRILISGDTISAIKHLSDYTMKIQKRLDSATALLKLVYNNGYHSRVTKNKPYTKLSL